MAMLILERLSAVRFERDLVSGSTRPCIFSCVNEAGHHAGEYVVKFRSEVRGNELGLMFEVFAAQLAACLCIPMPNPALIRFPSDLADAMPEASVASRVRRSEGLNFGTRFLGRGYATWLVDDQIPNSLLSLAAAIVAFDALIDNADRRPSALTRKDPGLLGKNDPLDLSAPDPKAEWTHTVNIADLACAKRLLVLLDGNLDTRSVSLRVKWRNFWRAPSVARLRRG